MSILLGFVPSTLCNQDTLCVKGFVAGCYPNPSTHDLAWLWKMAGSVSLSPIIMNIARVTLIDNLEFLLH